MDERSVLNFWFSSLLFSSLLSQDLFDSIKKRFSEQAKYELALLKQKGTSLSDANLRLGALIRELPLTKDQQDELVKMIEAIKL